MKTFTTPGPAAVMVRFAAGRLYVRTARRPRSDHHVGRRATGQPRQLGRRGTRRRHHRGQRGETIELIAPTSKGWFGRTPRLEVRLVVPAHSRVDADVKSADVQLAGELGEVFVATASGDVAVEHAAELQVRTASGDVSCRSVAGDASVNTASGDARLDTVGRSAELATASGDVTLLHVGGDTRARSASGDVVIRGADGSVTVRTASATSASIRSTAARSRSTRRQ